MTSSVHQRVPRRCSWGFHKWGPWQGYGDPRERSEPELTRYGKIVVTYWTGEEIRECPDCGTTQRRAVLLKAPAR